MKITDLVIEVRNSDLERVAQLTPPESIGLTAVVRFNNVGNWSITLPANNPKADLLREPGAGLIVNGPDGVIFSGPTVSAKLVQTAENPAGDWVIEGVDDSVVLGERLAYPDPSEPDAGDQSTAYDEITDLASTVLYHYVDANIGPNAPTDSYIVGPVVRTNLVPFSTISANSGNFLFQLGTGGAATTTYITDSNYPSGVALRRTLTTIATGGQPFISTANALSANPAVTAGLQYTASFFVFPQFDVNARIAIPWRNSSGTIISTSTSTAVLAPANTLTRVSITATAPANAVAGGVRFLFPSGAGTAGQYIDFTSHSFEQSSLLQNYFDGNTANDSGPGFVYDWTGTPDASTSTASVLVSQENGRRIPNLTLAADTGLGSTVLGKARFDVLGPYLTKIAAIDGLGFNIRQIDDELVFTVYQPNDLSDTIRLDVENNRLASAEFTYAAPNATRAIVAGQGEGADRQIVEVTTTDAITAEGEWSRRIEVFKDQRDSDDPALLEQSGLEILTEDGKTLNAISVKPADNGLMRYGLDWNLGDLVSVVAGNQSVTAIVSEVGLSIEVDGVYLLATIGTPATADPQNKVAVTQSKQENRIANLERNETGIPVRGQVSRQTTGTITLTTQGVYVAAGLTPTFDTSVAVGTEIATTNIFGVKKTAPGKHFMRVYASTDAKAGNNQMLGIKIALNGTPIDESECRAFTGSNDQEAKLVTSWIIEMNEGDEVSLFMANHSGTTNIAFQRGRVIAAS